MAKNGTFLQTCIPGIPHDPWEERPVTLRRKKIRVTQAFFLFLNLKVLPLTGNLCRRLFQFPWGQNSWQMFAFKTQKNLPSKPESFWCTLSRSHWDQEEFFLRLPASICSLSTIKCPLPEFESGNEQHSAATVFFYRLLFLGASQKFSISGKRRRWRGLECAVSLSFERPVPSACAAKAVVFCARMSHLQQAVLFKRFGHHATNNLFQAKYLQICFPNFFK